MSGFARTLQRTDVGEPANRYVEMMVAASDQLAELLDELGLVARIESGRWEPNLQEVDTRELASEAASRLGAADVEGDGATAQVDRDAATTAVYQLARCALRHGGLDRIGLRVESVAIGIAPVVPGAAPVVMGEQARDLGALIAARIVRALGGSLELEDERLLVRFPA